MRGGGGSSRASWRAAEGGNLGGGLSFPPQGGPQMAQSNSEMNPGDEAPPGTAGTGEDVCPTCHGSGRVESAKCETCGGTGKGTRAIGGGGGGAGPPRGRAA